MHDDATQEPLLNLAPKRPNWDLKRDLEPQMKKLRSLTDRSIVKLIAQRVAAEQEEQQGEGGEQVDLAAAVDRGVRRDLAAAEDDD